MFDHPALDSITVCSNCGHFLKADGTHLHDFLITRKCAKDGR